MSKELNGLHVYNVTLVVACSVFTIPRLASTGLEAIKDAKRELVATLPWASENSIKVYDIVKEGN
jgi:hypothetical protein